MRVFSPIAVILACAVPLFAGDTPVLPSRTLCAGSTTGPTRCGVSKKDLKAAKNAFERGMRLQRSRHFDDALEQFESAAKLVPQNVEYATARETTRQQLVFEHMERGNSALMAGNEIQAMAEFRSALQLDPDNRFARQRMTDALGESAPKVSSTPQVVADAGEIQVQPSSARADFHFAGDSRDLLAQVAKVYGITPMLDESLISRRVRFDIDQVDFFTAMQAANDVTHSFWTPLDEKQILIANDTPDNHRQFDRMAARTFYIPGTSSPNEVNDLANALRTLFDIRFLSQRPNAGTITVRAPQNMLDAATEFLQGLDASRPQVMLDVRLYQISSTLTRDFGVHIPYQFQLINIPAAALAALGGQNIQDLINQLIASGGINQANSTAISALLAQLQGQQNSIFSQPLATFGGGKTFFGVSLDHLTATLAMNKSSVQNLEHAVLRAGDGQDSTFRVGSRFPILNASFAPVFNSPAIAKVIGNQSFTAPFPSFSYEDLGLTVKAKPRIHSTADVTLQLEVEVRSLGGTSLNGVPILNNRQYKGTITVKEGEPAVVAGSISRTEQRSLSGIPGLGQVPLLNKVYASNSQTQDEDELLLVITPHIVSGAAEGSSEIWLH